MEIVALAKQAGRSGQITIATAFGCPFEGEIAIGRVVEMAKRAADAEPREIALADTIGVGVPTQVAEMIGRVREAVGSLPIQIGRAHVCTPVTNAQLVCRLLLEKIKPKPSPYIH